MKKYTLEELLAECKDSAPMPDDMKDWLNMPDVGRERLDFEESLQSNFSAVSAKKCD